MKKGFFLALFILFGLSSELSSEISSSEFDYSLSLWFPEFFFPLLSILYSVRKELPNHELLDDDAFCKKFAAISFLFHVEEISVPVQETNSINLGFLQNELCDLEHQHLFRFRDVTDVRTTRRRRLPTEKLSAKLTTALNDYHLLKVIVRSMCFEPGMKKQDVDRIWREIHENLWTLLDVEYKSVDPFLIQEETRFLCAASDQPFDSRFYETRFLPKQRSFLNNVFRQKEVNECLSILRKWKRLEKRILLFISAKLFENLR